MMAERRMFAKTIIDSDAFLDMPLSTQALYFHLSMRADDDGFINNPKKIQRMIGGSDDDIKLLIAKNFIIPFDSGVVVIKHWRIHNYIQKDRYHETVYKDEKNLLEVKDNNAYKLMDTGCIHDGYRTDTQVRLGKVSLELGKDSLELGKDSLGEDKDIHTSKPQKRHYAEFVTMTEEEYNLLLKKLNTDDAVQSCIEILDNYKGSKGKRYKSDYRAILSWVISEYEKRRSRKPRGDSIEDMAQQAQDILDRGGGIPWG